MKLMKLFLVGIVASFSVSLSAQEEEETHAYFWADTVTVVGEKEVKLPMVNAITTKMFVDLQLTPASVGVVTKSIIENQNGSVLSDAINNISGVNVQSQFGVHDYFIIRGFDSISSGLILTDGTPEPEATFYHLYNIEAVEVLKGPGAFLYGGNPLSGTINLSRKQPLFSNFANASGSYGKFQSYRGIVDFGLTNQNKNFAFRLNGLFVDSDSYRDGKNNEVMAVNPAITWRINERSNLNVNFEYVKSEYTPDSGLPIQLDLATPQIPDNISRTSSFQPETDFSDQKVARFKLNYDLQINESFFLRSKFYYTDQDWQSQGTLITNTLSIDPDPNTYLFRTDSKLADRQKMLGNQLELVSTFRTGSANHTLLTGFEVTRLSDDFDLEFVGLPEVLLGDLEVEGPGYDLSAGIPQFLAIGDGRSLTFAPYFIDRVSFSEKVQLFLGGRFDRINYQDDDRVDFEIFFQAVPDTTSTDRTYKKFSPMVGLVVSPTPNVSLYANFGQAFAPPSTTVPGDLKAEESTQFEVGIKNRFLNGKLHFNVAVYSLERENIPIRSSFSPKEEIGTQKSKGLELEMSGDFGQGLFAFLSYAFTDAELTKFTEFSLQQFQSLDFSGKTAAFAPEHILNFWITKEFSNGLGIAGGGRYLSEQYIAPDNAYKIDSAFTLDAAVSYRFNRFRWSANFKNITNTESEARGFRNSSVIPTNPFAVYGSVDFSL